ncbi:MAG: hypothetical protein M0Z33_07215 [Actinomycetota bacterium]|nr:hypothetical protein [Actinomycetota bacterium]
MTLFSALSIAGSGVDAMQTWIDTAGGNIANANDAVPPNQPAYAAQTTLLSPVGSPIPGQVGSGVQATVAEGSTTGVLAYEPNNPIAGPNGEVRVPNVSISNQLVGLIEAQTGYQANTSFMAHAVAAYQSGLTIGS